MPKQTLIGVAGSGSSCGNGGAGDRLPVNPRRHKVAPEQRKRVSTACNNCNLRRIKCSGNQPCRQCDNTSRACQYPVAVERVSIPRNELEELRSRCASLEKALQDAVPNDAQRQLLLSRPTLLSTTSASVDALSSTADAETPSEDDPSASGGRLLQDLDGQARYLGETSGATFLDNLKQFMATIFPIAFNGTLSDVSGVGADFLSSVGRYQTHDSRPLMAPPSVNPYWLPHAHEMSARLSDVRFFLQEDRGVSGGIMYFGNLTDLPRDTGSASTLDPGGTKHLAFYNAAFAYSTLLDLTTTNSKQDGQLGEAFFARAKELLGSPLDITTYTFSDVAVMTLMAMYMIEMNRRDVSYMYITIAMHISIMHGAHRGLLVDEHGKRIFWTVYTLDRWIACLMGRPPTIHDNAITLELPREVPGLPTPVGLRANIELSKIAGYIVCNTYRIAPWTDTPLHTNSNVDTALQLLSNWEHTLPPALQMPSDLNLPYTPFTHDRPLCVMHMSYNQLLILTIRPILFTAVKKAVADRFVARRYAIEEHPQITNIRACSDAARRNLRLGRWVQESSSNQKLMMADLHAIFNATIILLLHQTVFINLRTNDIKDIAFGTEVFEREAETGDIYAKDCSRVLHELSVLVGRLRNLMFDGVPQISPQIAPLVPVLQNIEAGMGAQGFGLIPLGTDPVITIQMPGEDNLARIQQMVAWLDDDDSILYNYST